jgi:hypothetical protein
MIAVFIFDSAVPICFGPEPLRVRLAPKSARQISVVKGVVKLGRGFGVVSIRNTSWYIGGTRPW